MMISRRRVIQAAGAGAAAMMLGPCRVSTEAQQPARRPNVVLILADDLGYGDLRCYGATDTATPHIDKLAAEGARFTDGYSCAPLCAPARAALLSGRYQQRFGFEFNPIRPAPADWGIPSDERLLSEDLKAAGYATGLVGKWHLGPGEVRHPMKRGFDEFFGFIGGKHRYLELGRKEPDNPIMRGMRAVDEQAYLTEAFTREAIGFIERHKAEPFFLYLSPNAVHGPLQRPPEQYYSRFGHIKDEPRRILAAMLSALDDQVGAVREKLRQVGVLDNTLTLFMSDNGGPLGPARNAPLRGVKTELYEGGIRVPFIINQPGRISAGVRREAINQLDVYPTLLEVCGAKRGGEKALEGMSWMREVKEERALCWRHAPELAIRMGKWKVVKVREEAAKLFDLESDVGETKDLAAMEPRRMEELMEEWKRWDEKNIPGKWAGFQKNMDS